MKRKQRRQAAIGRQGHPGETRSPLHAAVEPHRAGRLDKAATLYRRALKQRPENAEALHLLGVLLHQQGKHEEALRALEKAVALEDGVAMYHFNFGEVLRALDRAEEASARYRRALALEPANADVHFALGTALLEQGDSDAAVSSIRRALELRPGDVEAWLNLGNALADKGAPDEAIAAFRRALAIAPGYAEAHVNLGTVLQQGGDWEGAVACFERALEVAPDFVEAHYNLGVALAEQDDLEPAIAAYRAALAHDPEHTSALLNLGALLRRQGDAEGAIESYRQALEIKSDLAAAHINLGNLLQQEGNLEEAEAAFRKGVAAAPDDALAWLSLGNFLKAKGAFDEAIGCYRRGAEREPNLAVIVINLGNALLEKGELDAALEQYRQALAMEPESAEAYFNLSVGLRQQGKFDAARQALERAIAIRPVYAEALAATTELRAFTEDDREIARLRAALDKEERSPEQRIHLNFALGKIYDDLGRYDEAFAHFRVANRLKDAEMGFDAAANAALVRRLRDTFDGDFLSARRDWGVPSELPVFVLGMPRSGTTLVEQILSSHPAVCGAGELRKLGEIADALPARLGTEPSFPECAALLDAAGVESLAREYLDFLGGFAAEAARITDKMPHNFLRLGLIALLLPAARIVHCRRDPLDTCLSCYFQHFGSPYEFAYDLDSLGAYYRDYEALMAHWGKVLPGAMLELQYEDLVADQEGVSREIVAFCGLEWDDRCLAFHDSPRPVRTASQWQVRQPLFTSSLGRWRHYEKHLGPLRAALEGGAG